MHKQLGRGRGEKDKAEKERERDGWTEKNEGKMRKIGQHCIEDLYHFLTLFPTML